MSQFELMRIIAMLMIVAHHAVIKGVRNGEFLPLGITPLDVPPLNRVVSSLLVPGGPVGVGLFFMLTGYFLVGKTRITGLRRILSEIVFYGMVVGLALVALPAYGEGWHRTVLFLKNPVFGGGWWFATCYVLLLLFLPWVNPILQKLNRTGYLASLLFVFFFWYCGDGLVYPFFKRAIFYYVLGAFCARAVPRPDWRIAVASIFVASMGWSAYAWIDHSLRWQSVEALWAARGVPPKVFVPAIAFFTFQFFRSLPTFHSILVNRIASTCFGVYLLHCNPLEVKLLWNRLLHLGDSIFASSFFPLAILFETCLVFAVCSAIDLARQRWLEPWVFRTEMVFYSFIKRHLSVTTMHRT